MKKILLPTDFSSNSWNAISYALQLFKDKVCKFYLLHTYTPMIYHTEFVLVNPSQYGLGDAVMEKALKKFDLLKEQIETTFKNPKHSIEVKAVFNTLVTEIKDMVQEENIDYVIMGTKGASGIEEVLFGSNTVHVFKNVKCSILAIPEKYTFEAPHEVLFPTDYEIDYNDIYMKPIIDILSLYKTRVNVLNVSYGYDLSEKQTINKSKLETYLKNISHMFHSVSNQTVPQAISDFQLNARINLLVMINNKHSFFDNLFFKSTINQIGFHLNIPFLVIPAQ
ncbi:universal stress protein [Seonamhaeicola sediminis]|uniref:Universal stress protein n=1 Tax=Seonamhaeicola sediminis TaxID=2528206 RepID=A0A562YEE8_9FLAO|nr:universal stress protein [Seonamhaeicola sediminis]TWO32899.1 universal stress protein [Seonamhaeicola sediminis]